MSEKEPLRLRDFLKVAGLFVSANYIRPKEMPNIWPPQVVSGIVTDRPEYALTIDDGWSPESLVGMLDILKERSWKADFFLVGLAAINCERTNPGLLNRISEEGHRIAYHTFEHTDITGVDAEWLSEDFNLWTKTLRKRMGSEAFSKSFFWGARAPYGNFTASFIQFCDQKGLVPYGWLSDPSTFNRGIPIRKGDILLLHARRSDVEYLKQLDSFTEERLTPTTITFLANPEPCNPTHPVNEEEAIEEPVFRLGRYFVQ